jgi:membrane protein implicated in regulation of membrane protease activity
MRYAFVGSILLGLVLAVFAMLNGVERPEQRPGRRRFALNVPTVAAFATVFGATGYPLAVYSSLGWIAVLSIAVAAGVAGALASLSLVAGWAIPAAKAEVVDERYVLQGCIAKVTEVLADGSGGTIAFDNDGVRQTSRAVGLDGARLELGTEVAIERVEGGVAYVEPWSQVEARL